MKLDYTTITEIKYLCYSIFILIFLMAGLHFLHEDINKKLEFKHEEELMKIQYQIQDIEVEE